MQNLMNSSASSSIQSPYGEPVGKTKFIGISNLRQRAEIRGLWCSKKRFYITFIFQKYFMKFSLNQTISDPEKAPESISKAVASLPPEQMFELMKQMKTCIQQNPEEAKHMLLKNPQLSYALLQALVVMRYQI